MSNVNWKDIAFGAAAILGGAAAVGLVAHAEIEAEEKRQKELKSLRGVFGDQEKIAAYEKAASATGLRQEIYAEDALGLRFSGQPHLEAQLLRWSKGKTPTAKTTGRGTVSSAPKKVRQEYVPYFSSLSVDTSTIRKACASLRKGNCYDLKFAEVCARVMRDIEEEREYVLASRMRLLHMTFSSAQEYGEEKFSDLRIALVGHLEAHA